jgi:hypothetical protein
MCGTMYDQPYLETCCRAALHRLVLAGPPGRPGSGKDGPCLARLTGMGLACEASPGQFTLTDAGTARHASEVLGRSA